MKKFFMLFFLCTSFAFAADIRVRWDLRPPAEKATGYNVYRDAVQIGNVNSSTSEFIDRNVPIGPHSYTVAATDIWGLGPVSDPVSTSPGVGKVTGVSIEVLPALLIYSISIDQPVSTIQMDLTTTGVPALAPAAVAAGKTLATSTINGKLRVIISGMNQTLFSGTILTVDAQVSAAINVSASNAAGQPVSVVATITEVQ